jgi:hypothetical protein
MVTAQSADRFPNLFLPGAAKSGTTTLHEYLSSHPDIQMAAGKEPHCLCRSDRSIGDYAKIFGDHRAVKYRGDASTMYMIYPGLIPVIKANVSAPKLIFVLRNPVDRAWSHYWWARGRAGRESLSFKDAFTRDVAREPHLPCGFNNHYYQCGRYAHWLGYFGAAFPSECILILTFDQLIRQPRTALACVWRFLGVSDIPFRVTKRANPTGLIRFPGLFRAHSMMGRRGRRLLSRWLPTRALDSLTRVYLHSRTALLSTTRRSEPPLMGDQERAWIAAHYTSDILALRRSHPAFGPEWVRDFPA